MNSKKTICLILIKLSVLSVFGACPFENFTDVVTACAGDNDLGIVYPAGTSGKEVETFPLRNNERAESGFSHGIGCLEETPSPSWYAIKIDEPGDLLMKISHSAGADIDFACWGPFKGDSKQEMLEDVCNNADSYFADLEIPKITNTCKESKLQQCESMFAVREDATAEEKTQSRMKISQCKMEVDQRSKTDSEYECFYANYNPFPIAHMADCSYSNSATESCFIGNAKKGDWYLILVTNLRGIPGNIKFTHESGRATTDCDVIVDAGCSSAVCEGEDIKLYLNNLPAYATCKWTGPNGFESDKTTPVINNATRENAGIYYVQITTHDGLQSEEYPVFVTVITNTPIDTTLRVVKGEVVNFKGVEYSKEGEYTMSENSGQCVKNYNIKVVEVPLLPAYIEQNGPICEGEMLELSIGDAPTEGVADYEWFGPNGFHSHEESVVVPNMNLDKAGSYSLKIKKDGLTYPVAPVDVKVIPKTTEKVFQHIPFGESFEFAGEVLTKRGTYFGTFESIYGCDSIVELILIPDVPELVPDEFITPNGDGDNDIWHIKNIEYSQDAVVRIYDRTGKQVYEGTNYSSENAWDGRDMQGRKLPSTDYWYTIDVQTADRVYFGHVTLLR